MDLNILIHNVLSPLVRTFYEEAEFADSNLPDEYIVYKRIYGSPRNFADGEPLHNYHFYRINYYGKDKEKRQIIMSSIKSSMKDVGFHLQTDNTPIPREVNAEYWGAYSEFSYWEVISDEN